MLHLILAANPVIAVGGQVAAIVIGLYALIFILVAVAFNFAMAVAFGLLRDKISIIKRLRPTVESVNKTAEIALSGQPIPEDTNSVVKAVGQAPEQVRELNKKVDQGTDKVVKAAIEFRARTVQVQTVAKAFIGPFLPKLHLLEEPPRVVPAPTGDENALDIKSPGYRILMEKTPDVPAISSKEIAPDAERQRSTQQANQAAMQYSDVPTRS
jgi:hypothetical protein